MGFSLVVACGFSLLQLWRMGSRARGLCSWRHAVSLIEVSKLLVVAVGLSCPSACGILVPRPGIEPESPALEGRFFTAEPPENSSHVHFINLFILFIYFWLCWVFVAVHGLSLIVVSGGYSSLRCVGFSLGWLLLLRSTGSRHAGFSSCGSRALECRLSNCGARA